jgi:fructosamine-3-kinase
MTDSFRKTHRSAPADYYQAEAASLRWLAVEGGPPVPKVLEVADSHLDLEHIAAAAASPQAVRNFGRGLAHVHQAGAPHFGAAPPGAPQSGFIGVLRLEYGEFETFGPMYAKLRIEPYLQLAMRAGSITPRDADPIQELCERLENDDEKVIGPKESPQRIHGDLWAGNVLWAPDRDGRATGWLVDSAAYGGHRESDLAMLQLFGMPRLDQLLVGYQEVEPLAIGWKRRISMHQVYPLLVHTVLFGGSFAGRAVSAARQALMLADI